MEADIRPAQESDFRYVSVGPQEDPLSKAAEDLPVVGPSGTMAKSAEATHGSRLIADHARHGVLASIGGIEIAAQSGLIAEGVALTVEHGLNIGVGGLLVVGVLPNLASKLALLCSYKKRLSIIEKQEATCRRALEAAKGELPSVGSAEHKVHSVKIMHLQRELDRCERAREALKESRFRMATAANNAVEVSAGAVRIAQHAGSLAGTVAGQAALGLKFAVPCLGCVIGAFWAMWGGVMSRKAMSEYLDVRKQLKECEAELFLTDPLNRERVRKFYETYPHPIESLEGKSSLRKRFELNKWIQEEYKSELNTYNLSLLSLTAQRAELEKEIKENSLSPDDNGPLLTLTKKIADLEEARPRPLPITLDNVNTALGKASEPPHEDDPTRAECLAVRKAFLEKKVKVVEEEGRKQFFRFCHYALLVTIGVLGVAAGAIAIAATAGAALPAAALLGLFVVMIPVGGGVLGTDLAAMIQERIKGGKQREIPRTLAAAQLSHVLALVLKQDEGKLLQEFKICTSRQLEDKAMELYQRKDISPDDRKRILRAVGLDPTAGPADATLEYIADLAKKISDRSTLDEQQEDLKALGIELGAGVQDRLSEAKLLSILSSELGPLVPQDEGEEARHFLSSMGIHEFVTPTELARNIFYLEKEGKKTVLQKMDLRPEKGQTDFTKEGLAKMLGRKFPQLFSRGHERSARHLLSWAGINKYAFPKELAKQIRSLPQERQGPVCELMGLAPSGDEKVLAQELKERFPILFPIASISRM